MKKNCRFKKIVPLPKYSAALASKKLPSAWNLIPSLIRHTNNHQQQCKNYEFDSELSAKILLFSGNLICTGVASEKIVMLHPY